MSGERILIVEDEASMRRLLRRCLEAEGFRTCEAAGADGALTEVGSCAVDLVTLDIGLGGDDGFGLARAIRRISDVPIVIVTGRGEVIDRVVGLELGADDYIAKPFHAREVAARIRAVLRRTRLPAEAPTFPTTDALRFDGLVARLDAFECLGRDGARLDMTAADFRLLRAFVEHPKRVLSRDRLMELVGGPAYNPYDRAIDNQVARLRRKIERDPADPRLIVTVRGVGYSFAGDVERG
jgi:DNA-binding response OmpR family regulator